MAQELTAKEKGFLAGLEGLFPEAEAITDEQKKLRLGILTRVKLLLEQDGDATIGGVLKEIQAAANEPLNVIASIQKNTENAGHIIGFAYQDALLKQGVKQTIEKEINYPDREQNETKAQTQFREGLAKKLTEAGVTGPIGAEGSARINQIGAMLTQTLTPEKLQAVGKLGVEAGLEAGDISPLKINYHAPLHTTVKIDADLKTIAGEITDFRSTKAQAYVAPKAHPKLNTDETNALKASRKLYVVQESHSVPGEYGKNGKPAVATDSVHDLAFWLLKNGEKPPATSPDSSLTQKQYDHLSRVEKIQSWLVSENGLTTIDGKRCNGKSFRSAMIMPHQQLALPEGMEPPAKMSQGYMVCSSCKVTHKLLPPSDLGKEVEIAVTPPVKTTVPENTPEIKLDPIAYATSSTPSSHGKELIPGSAEHSMWVYALSGLDMKFSKEFFDRPHNITPRESVKRADGSGQLEDFTLQGKFFGESDASNQDNAIVKHRFATTGTPGKLGLYNPRGRVKEFGWAEDFSEDGRIVLQEKNRVVMATSDGHVATSLHLPFSGTNVVIPLPMVFKGMVTGASVHRPDEEPIFITSTGWKDLIGRVDVALPGLNFSGKSTMFMDEVTKLTDRLISAQDFNKFTMLQNSGKVFVDAMGQFNGATDPHEKQQAAELALVAMRDFSENKIVLQSGIMTQVMNVRIEGLRESLTRQGVVLDAAADARILHHERLVPSGMTLEQMKELPRFNDDNPEDSRKYKGFVVGGQINPKLQGVFKSIVNDAYGPASTFEVQLADEKVADPLRKPLMANVRELVVTVKDSTPSLVALGKGLKDCPDSVMALSEAMHDMTINPKNYGFGSRREATEFVASYFGPETEAALKDITNKGKTIPFPASFIIGDQPIPNARPDLVEKALTEKFNTDPASLGVLLDKISDPVPSMKTVHVSGQKYEVDDGRVYGAAFFRGIASQKLKDDVNNRDENGKIVHGAVPSTYAAFVATLPNEKHQGANDVMANLLRYSETGYQGRSNQGVQYLDNIGEKQALEERQAQQRMMQGKTVETSTIKSNNELYREAFLTDGARNADADKVAVQGLLNHVQLTRDMVIKVAIEKPEALKPLQQLLRDMADSAMIDKYRNLGRAINNAIEAGEDYQAALKNGEPLEKQYKLIEKAAMPIAKFFAKMEANDDNNRGALRYNAWHGAVKKLGEDDAMVAAFLEVAAEYAPARDALLISRGYTVSSGGAHHTNRGRVGSGKQFEDPSQDDLYHSPFITMPVNRKGEVSTGPLSLRRPTIHAEQIAAAMAGGTTFETKLVDGNTVTIDAAGQQVNDATLASLKEQTEFAATYVTKKGARGSVPVTPQGDAAADGADNTLVDKNGAPISPDVLATVQQAFTPQHKQAITAATRVENNVLGVDAAHSIVLGKGEDAVQVYAHFIEASVKNNPNFTLPPGKTYSDLAQADIDEGLVKLTTNASDVLIKLEPEGVRQFMDTGIQAKSSLGIRKAYFAFLISPDICKDCVPVPCPDGNCAPTPVPPVVLPDLGARGI